jgi:tetratricopeptide (TPR) repeat protein
MWTNTSARAFSRVLYTFRAVLSVFSDEKKLSIAELSQTLPGRLIEQVMPLSDSSRGPISNSALAGTGDLPRARNALTEALERSPDTLVALNALAEIEQISGQYGEALRLYTQSLAIDSKQPFALGGRAAALIGLGRHAEATQSVAEALRQMPGNPNLVNIEGEALARLGRFPEAVERFSLAQRARPNDAQFLINLARTLAQIGNHSEAATHYAHALRLRPHDIAMLEAFGVVLQRLNRHMDAIRAFKLARRLTPESADLSNRIAQSFLSMEKWTDAVAAAQEALILTPGHADALFNLGMAQIGARHYSEAVQCFDQLLEHGPDDNMALLNLGNALTAAGRPNDAIAAFLRLKERMPNWAGLYLNMGHALMRARRADEAIAAYTEGLRLEPGNAQLNYSLGNLHLHLGNFERGLPGYEHRNEQREAIQRCFDGIAVWLGEPLSGRRVLVFGEQGLGDNLQMLRYLPIMQKQGAAVTFHGYPMLHALFAQSAPGVTFMHGQPSPADFDFQVASMSLPLRFGTRVDTIPGAPYLKPNPARVAHWASTIGNSGFRIGVVWQGNPSGKIDEGRSAPLALYGALGRLPGTRLISLQKNFGLDQLKILPDGMAVETLGDAFDSAGGAFMDSAAVMSLLDLVVTTDTSVAHVAGGLGVRTWLALKYLPDWRWLLDRDDSPWYPTMRLFRQPSDGRWGPVFEAMATELAATMENS